MSIKINHAAKPGIHAALDCSCNELAGADRRCVELRAASPKEIEDAAVRLDLERKAHRPSAIATRVLGTVEL